MIKNNKNNILRFSLWWVDFLIINNIDLKYKYSFIDNIFSLDIKYIYMFFFFNKKNIYTSLFYILDILYNVNSIKISYQSFFFDLKVLINFKTINKYYSLSNIYNSCIWLEREFKEINNINIVNLKDYRKLLYNYNYNKKFKYNNYSNIISDLLI